MNIIHVLPELQKSANGVNSTIPRLLQAMAENGHSAELYTIGAYNSALACGIKVRTFPESWFPIRSFYRSTALKQELVAQAEVPGIIHAHALWLYPMIAASEACRKGQASLVVSTHGMLSPWALHHRQWKKWIVNNLAGHRKVFSVCKMFQVSCEMEYQELRQYGITRPICIIPWGIDIPEIAKIDCCSKKKKLLYLGRIHPKKGIYELLDAWQSIEPRHPEWQLEIVGPDNEYASEMRRIIQEKKLASIAVTDQVTGDLKIRKYAESSLFVLPSHSENFGMTIAEALCCKTPVITTRQTPWRGLIDKQCGWWIGDNAEELSRCMDDAMSRSEAELLQMGECGRLWMAEDFSWQNIAKMMYSAYQWVLDPSRGKPDFVKVD